MTQNLTLWDQIPEASVRIRLTGAVLRNTGMQQAVEHADQVTEQWSDKAYRFLMQYIQFHESFMAEDVRKASQTTVPEPPSARAWGAIFMKAAKQNKIMRIGFRNVENPNAHCTPATLWKTVR